MDNYSCAESGDSSPRSRDQLDQLENSLSWDDQHHQLSPNFRVKFMCSYGGRIIPRLHDNQLFYIGGDTKILAVQRCVKFYAFMARLSSLCDGYVSFKYQLPGEDLDSLISVTNDDDLEHMMQEYDRMYKASSKPARLRLFLFQENNSNYGTISSDGDLRSERERFVDALNTAPASQPPLNLMPQNNTSEDNRTFNLDEEGTPLAELGGSEPVISTSSPDLIQDFDFQRLHIAAQQQQQPQLPQPNYYEKITDHVDNITAGDFYAPEKGTPPDPMNPISVNYLQAAPSHWPEGVSQPASPAAAAAAAPDQQSVYMIPTTSSGMYHAPMIRQVASTSPGTGSQGFYLHRVNPSGVYGWDQASSTPYGVVPSSSVLPPHHVLPTSIIQQQQQQGMGYMPMMTYYSASPPGGMMLPPPSPYQPVSAASDHMRVVGSTSTGSVMLNIEESGRSV